MKNSFTPLAVLVGADEVHERGDSIEEGVSLRQQIDTTYENTVEHYLGDYPGDDDAPRDLKRFRYPDRWI